MKLNLVIFILVVFLGVFVGLKINNKEHIALDVNEKTTNKEELRETEKTTKPKEVNLEETANQKYNYKIMYEVDKRYDGATSYYVLIDSVSIEKAKFKDEIIYIVEDLVKEKGSKISVEIFDNQDALILHYKFYGNMSLGRELNNKEYIFLGNHYLAGFSGELDTGLFLNTLYYYPAANPKDNPLVAKYSGAIEYNPQN